jgi:hypothetical protein
MSAVRKPVTNNHPTTVRGRITSNLGTGVLPGEDGATLLPRSARRRLGMTPTGNASELSDLGYPPSRPITVACCTASLREETLSFR